MNQPDPVAEKNTVRHHLSLFALFFAFLLGSCATPDQTVPPSNVSEWHLDADIDTEQRVTLSKGMSIDEVKSLLGSPYRVWKRKGKESHTEILTYKRNINGPAKPFTIRNGNRLIRGTQPIRYVDTVTIEFSAGILQSADVSRETQPNSPGSWEHMKP